MSKLDNGLADYSSTMPLFSTAFWIAWITVIYSGDTIIAPALDAYRTTATVFTISTATLGVTLFAAAIFSQRATHVIENKAAMLAVALLCSFGTIGVAFEGMLPFAAFIACASTTGFATAFIALRGISLYAEVGTQKAALASCFSLIIGSLLYALASMFTLFYGPVGTLILETTFPFFAVFLAFIPFQKEPDTTEENDGADLSLSPAFWKLVAFLAVIAFSESTIRGLYPKLISAEAFSASRCTVALGLIAMAATIIAIVARKPRNYKFGKLFYWLFVSSVLLVAPVVVTGINSTFLGVLASIANGLLLLMSWNFLARVSFCSGMSCIRVFGFGFGIAVLGVTFGFAVGDTISYVLPNLDSSILGIVFLAACLLATLLLLRERDVNGCMVPTHEMLNGLDEEAKDYRNSLDMPSGATSLSTEERYVSLENNQIDECSTIVAQSQQTSESEIPGNKIKRGKFLQKCDAIAEQYGLTAREAEVFELLAKHMEAQAIADELFISFNTTRTHIRKIYSKLDIHSRRELTELIDNYTL